VFDLAFTVDAQGATTPLTLAIDRAVMAGWTGRDLVARDRHIAELEAIGIARPATTPIYYRVAARRLTMADSIEVSGGETSGEVEFVLIGWEGRIFVGVGSDHTDRKVESYSVTVSKQMCDKPIASVLWELEDVAGHWDRMILRAFAWIGGARVLYQEGALDAMLPVDELIRGFGGARLPWLRDVRRHVCGQGRHPPREPVRIRARRPGAEAQDRACLRCDRVAGAGVVPSLRGALAMKQSSLSPQPAGLLRGPGGALRRPVGSQ
jgi:hypothetical protein